MKTDNATIIRSICLWLSIINQILVAMGKSPLPIDDSFISTLVLGFFALWSWWKNNSFTSHAKQADDYMKKIKGGSNGCL